ncbi:MAG: SAM-dependent methyltransferase [Oligoflexia bacterium]|nr:SAM-dependent methyltransferase [Oligoflexia bacterium]
MLCRTPTPASAPILEAALTDLLKAPPRPAEYYTLHWGEIGPELRAADFEANLRGWRYGEFARAEFETVLAGIPVGLDRSGTSYTTRTRWQGLQNYLLANLQPDHVAYAPDQPTGGLSVKGSLLCLEDHFRTLGYLAALREAITQLQKNTPAGKDIFVVDAGCGAAPLLGLYAALLSPHVKVLALEVNPASARLARAIVKKFGLADRMQISLRDATSITLTRQIDLLISDTLHTGLSKEPLVQVFQNLMPYLSDQGIAIPRQVTVKAGLVAEREFLHPAAYFHIAEQPVRAVDVIWQSSFFYQAGAPISQINLQVDASALGPGPYVAMVGSDVDLGFGHTLSGFDSLITHPFPVIRSRAFFHRNSLVLVSSNFEHGSRRASISYAPGEIPVLGE